jgi:hypothetical protein
VCYVPFLLVHNEPLWVGATASPELPLSFSSDLDVAVTLCEGLPIGGDVLDPLAACASSLLRSAWGRIVLDYVDAQFPRCNSIVESHRVELESYLPEANIS